MKSLYIAAIFFSAALSAQNTSVKITDAARFNTSTERINPKPIVFLDGKIASMEFINNVSPNSIASINIHKGANAVEKFGMGEKEGIIDIKLKPGTKILNYQQLMEQYHLDPALHLVANKTLVKNLGNFYIDQALIASVQILDESPFAEPVIPHLPGEKMVYITLRSQ